MTLRGISPFDGASGSAPGALSRAVPSSYLTSVGGASPVCGDLPAVLDDAEGGRGGLARGDLGIAGERVAAAEIDRAHAVGSGEPRHELAFACLTHGKNQRPIAVIRLQRC